MEPGATVVIERGRGSEAIALPDGWDVRRERSYGDTLLILVSA